jgi:endonuclease/exonuclease/phosphatase family metal-dependent hydrolase
MGTVRVLTWNLWWRFGDWERRQKAIDAVLQEIKPDICCFQEVWSTDREDAAVLLGEAIGLPHFVRSYSNTPEVYQQRIGEPGVDFGNAVVSRWPVTATQVRNLPGDHGRTALAARVATPDGDLPVVCTHLASHPAASAERCAQVRAVVDLVARFGRDELPPVVAGDLNAEPDSDEVRLLGGFKTAPAVPGLFFFDAWRRADDARPGWTWLQTNPHVPEAFGFNARIDYIHVGAAGPRGRGTISQIFLAGDREFHGIWPSDHAAVVVDVTT